jgi:5-methylcytosine-specific restriction endonuclease McrA
MKAQTAARKEQERKERESLPKPTGTCEWCGAEFVKKAANQICCCKEHTYQNDLRRKREEYEPKPASTKTCETCGVTFETARARQVFCSEACAKRMERRKERARGYRSHRSVNHYLQHYPEVFARDEGICQLCGLPIVPDAEQIWHGSLDHIIPQSLGGPDEVWNLRLAHVICNSIRQNDETMHTVERERLARYQGPFGSSEKFF